MRRTLIAIAIMLVFASNQAAVAFEQCEDPLCATSSMDAQKQAEHQKNDPDCAAHCAVSGHHLASMPQDIVTAVAQADALNQHWATALMPESATLEGLIEPPSLA